MTISINYTYEKNSENWINAKNYEKESLNKLLFHLLCDVGSVAVPPQNKIKQFLIYSETPTKQAAHWQCYDTWTQIDLNGISSFRIKKHSDRFFRTLNFRVGL